MCSRKMPQSNYDTVHVISARRVLYTRYLDLEVQSGETSILPWLARDGEVLKDEPEF
jgi:hypothetical protein